MKSYKINQAVEKTIFPIREDLSEIRQEVSEGWLRTKSYVDQIMQIFLPAIVSCILTAAISNPVLTSINRCNSNWINLLTSIAILCFLLLLFFSLSWLIIKFYSKHHELDEKKNVTARNNLVDFFYRIIVPEVINAKSLLEKADEPHNEAGKDTQHNSKLNKLFYYEALYYMESAYRGIMAKHIVEYHDSNRPEYIDFLSQVNANALQETINVCIDNMDEIALKTNDDRANELRGRFIDLRDTLTLPSVSGN